MLLTLTHHIAIDTGTAARGLARVVSHGLDVAAARVEGTRDETVTELDPHGVSVRGGFQLLEGSRLRVSGANGLTTLEVDVPWTPADSDGRKFRAASAFADTVAMELALAS